MVTVPPSAAAVLAGLLDTAGLPAAVEVQPLTGRGFENEVYVAQLRDGRQVVLRRFPQHRPPEQPRASFLAAQAIPAPRFLVGTNAASLYEFAPGVLLGDLIEAGRASEATWFLVGQAFRRVHAVRFPAGLTGEFHPDELVLWPIDPVEQFHTWLAACEPRLRLLVPAVLSQLPALHALVDQAATALRTSDTALGHGDINMWNIIVAENHAWLIDWDGPRVCDPAMEVALLDKHAALFNGQGLGAAFFAGYGQPPTEPNTSLHRVVQTLRWATGPDWADFDQQNLPTELHERTHVWQRSVLAYVGELPKHIERLRRIVNAV